MIVISKKRISIIVMCLLIGILSYTYENSTSNKIKENVTETVATPASGKVIVVDAGHRKT